MFFLHVLLLQIPLFGERFTDTRCVVTGADGSTTRLNRSAHVQAQESSYRSVQIPIEINSRTLGCPFRQATRSRHEHSLEHSLISRNRSRFYWRGIEIRWYRRDFPPEIKKKKKKKEEVEREKLSHSSVKPFFQLARFETLTLLIISVDSAGKSRLRFSLHFRASRTNQTKICMSLIIIHLSHFFYKYTSTSFDEWFRAVIGEPCKYLLSLSNGVDRWWNTS